MKKIKLLFVLSIIFIACKNDDPGPRDTGNADWLIPSNLVFDGGPGKDGIPSIDDPLFGSIEQESANMDNEDYVVVVKSENEVKAYPHYILDWHEIVNDVVGSDTHIALTYCPLTGTAIGWDRKLQEGVTTFGVSGLLYNTNLMPYDRITESYWSQMLNQSVKGDKLATQIKTFPIVEMRFDAFREAFPDGKVLTSQTGFNRPYGLYPYNNYLQTSSTIFPVQHKDDRVFAKERVHGVQIGETTRVYRLESFENNAIITDQISGSGIVLYGDVQGEFIVSFHEKSLNNEVLQLQAVQGQGDVVLEDQFGNEWGMFGEHISGPDAGESLRPTPSYMGFYFAWVAFNEEVEIYGFQ